MKRYYSRRQDRIVDAIAIAIFIIDYNATVRQAAAYFGCSKSRIHEIITNCLKKERPQMYVEVKKVFDFNKAERHIRGGNATKKKFSK